MGRLLIALTSAFAGAAIALVACGPDDTTTPPVLANAEGDAEPDVRAAPAREAGGDIHASEQDAGGETRDASSDAAWPDAASSDAASSDAASSDAAAHAHARPPPPYTNPAAAFRFPDPDAR